MVYTIHAPRPQFHEAPAMQQPKRAISTPLAWVLKIRATERIPSLSRNHMRHVRSESARQLRIALFKSYEYYYYYY